jgi:uncharacterized membrane protein YphA (DoxX/SURF4 family)
VSTTTAPRSGLTEISLWVSTLARLLLAGVLLAAGVLKAIDPSGSVAAVRAYELVPPALATAIGWGLPFLEIGLGLLLAVGLHTRAAAISSAFLLLTLLAAVISVAARGLSIDCGCFGGGGPVAAGETRYTAEIVRDIGLLLLAGWLAWRPRTRFSLDRRDGGEPSG